MVKENIIIPKENKAQVEEVRYLDNQAEEQSKITKLATLLGVSRVYCAKEKDAGGNGGAGAGGGSGSGSSGGNGSGGYDTSIGSGTSEKPWGKAKDPEECNIL